MNNRIKNAVKIALTVIGLLSVAAPAQADLNTGLMAYYSFDDCSANDSSRNANNGTINGNLSCVDGVTNKALLFDGASYINVPDAASLNPTTQLTMSFWIRVDDFTNTYSPIIHKGGDAYNCFENREYSVWLPNDSTFQQMSAGDGSCQNAVASKKISTGKWLHYVGIIDRVKHIMSIYINGVLSAKTIDSYGSFNVNNHNLQIGYSEEIAPASYSPFKGALDEIRLYNRTLNSC